MLTSEAEPIRDRIESVIKTSSDRETRALLKDVLEVLDKPYDLEWTKTEFRLSPAEFRVLGLLVEGKNAAAIAEQLNIRVSTTRVHIYKIYRRMGVNNVVELTSLLLKRARNA